MNAVTRESEEIDASVRVARVVDSWRALSVREAEVADGRRASVGRVMVDSVYDVP